MSNQELLSIEGLRVVFPTSQGNLIAVDGLNLRINKGEIVGLVGESGSGKTVTGRAILRLVPKPGFISRGKIRFNNKDILQIDTESMRRLRGKEITAVQQDPSSSLNPAFKVQDQITDIMRTHKGIDKRQAMKEAVDLLQLLGITNPQIVMRKYPHQLSGGMAQRIMIGIAFSCSPSLIIADEPTTALDVITQATVIDLMKKLQKKYASSVLFITHNLGLAAKVCDKIAVMYAGKIVEFASVAYLFENPSHPYTKGLLSSVPKLSDETRNLSAIPGGLPSLINPGQGCRFAARCPVAIEQCTMSEIPYVELPQNEHYSLCIRALEVFDKKI